LQLLMPSTRKKLTISDKICKRKLVKEKYKRKLTKLQMKNLLNSLSLLILRLNRNKLQLLTKLCKMPSQLKQLE
jgi:hypothetical protein